MTQDNRNEEMDCRASEAPLLCSNNCGHYGSPATKNMCSTCYEDLLKHTDVSMNGLLEVPSLDSVADVIVKPKPDVDAAAAAAAPRFLALSVTKDMAYAQSSNSSRAWNRCLYCKRRVGLTGFRCRCGDMFCAVHRYSDKHNCSFDYKAAGRDAISKANPIIRAAKIQKI